MARRTELWCGERNLVVHHPATNGRRMLSTRWNLFVLYCWPPVAAVCLYLWLVRSPLIRPIHPPTSIVTSSPPRSPSCLSLCITFFALCTHTHTLTQSVWPACGIVYVWRTVARDSLLQLQQYNYLVALVSCSSVRCSVFILYALDWSSEPDRLNFSAANILPSERTNEKNAKKNPPTHAHKTYSGSALAIPLVRLLAK